MISPRVAHSRTDKTAAVRSTGPATFRDALSRAKQEPHRRSLRESIASLLVPEFRCEGGPEPILRSLGNTAPGGVFLYPDSSGFGRTARTLKEHWGADVLVLSDLEDNEYFADKPYADVPDLMAVSAAADPGLAFRLGEALGDEFRALGIDWVLGPNLDINENPGNPITNTRSFGDRASTVRRYGFPFARGLQSAGLLATAKHFPGDGLDDRDQHLTTSSNTMPMGRWRRTFGGLYRSVSASHLPAVMMGHIALPAYPAPAGENLAWPACIRPSIIGGLLRRECGFEGLVISDAVDMGGLLGWGPREEMLVRMMNAGVDVILFSRFGDDLDILLRAVRSGAVSRDRIEQAALRVRAARILATSLAAKADRRPRPSRPSAGLELRRLVASESLTVVHAERRTARAIPDPGKRVLSISVSNIPHLHAGPLEALLRRDGRAVRRIRLNPDSAPKPLADLSAFDSVIVSAIVRPSFGTNDIRINRLNARFLWLSLLGKRRPPVYFISFGSPYVYRDHLAADFCCNAYSPSPLVQEAVHAWLCGRLEPRGRSPVTIDCMAVPPAVRGRG